ncbi:MAG: signal peptidase I [Oscillospiraceae bacterium]|nr:signal peptidase I [Oscillospiraceae bacterium]
MIRKHKKILIIFSVLLICIALLWFFQNFRFIIVNGNSMSPSLNDGEIILTKKKTNTVNIDNIIIFKINNELFIKRIIAVSGDRVVVDESLGIVYVNGIEKIHYSAIPAGEKKEIIIPNNKFFVVGDNYNDSIDSRNNSIGLVDINTIEAVLVK